MNDWSRLYDNNFKWLSIVVDFHIHHTMWIKALSNSCLLYLLRPNNIATNKVLFLTQLTVYSCRRIVIAQTDVVQFCMFYVKRISLGIQDLLNYKKKCCLFLNVLNIKLIIVRLNILYYGYSWISRIMYF